MNAIRFFLHLGSYQDQKRFMLHSQYAFTGISLLLHLLRDSLSEQVVLSFWVNKAMKYYNGSTKLALA